TPFDNTKFGNIDVDGGDGSNTFNVLSAGHQISVDGGRGNDTYNIGENGVAVGVFGILSISDNAGSNSITLDNSADTTFRSLTISTEGFKKPGSASSLLLTGIAARGGMEVFGLYSGLTFNGGVGGSVITVKDTISNIGKMTLNGNAGNDTFAVEKSSSAIFLNGVNGQDIATIGLSKNGTQILRDV